MKVLVIPGSARPNTAGTEVVTHIERELAGRDGVDVTVATVDDMTLPFLDTTAIPAFDDYVIPEGKVADWTAKVDAADAFVFVIPEYNSGITALQKNSIDWVFKPWNGKRAALVTYNFYEKKSALDAILPILGTVQLTAVEPFAGLRIGEEIAPDGTVLDEAALTAKLRATVDALVAADSEA